MSASTIKKNWKKEEANKNIEVHEIQRNSPLGQEHLEGSSDSLQDFIQGLSKWSELATDIWASHNHNS